jgi:hypothetical protein
MLFVVGLGRFAAADVVRVTTAGATIRVSPAESATVISTPQVGSIFEVTASDMEWFTILMPSDKQGLRQYGYILRRQVELVPGVSNAPAQTSSGVSGSVAPSRPSTGSAPALAPDWGTRVRLAQARRAGGRAKFWGGIGALGGGAALITVMFVKVLDPDKRNCTDANPCYEYAWGLGAGVGAMVAGGILKGRGSRQVNAANRELIELETERINARPGAGIALPLFTTGALEPRVLLVPRERVGIEFELSW